MLALFKDESAADIYIDLGTANILIANKDKGLIINEPTLIATTEQNGRTKIIGVGKVAREKMARTPGHIKTIKPLKDGVIADFDTTEAMLRYYLTQTGMASFWNRPRVVISLPYGSTEVEKRAVIDAGKSAGASDVYLVDEPMVSAIGAGLKVREPKGNMIVDIGGGTTEVAIIALGDIVVCKSLRVGGHKFDQEIANYFKEKFKVVLSEQAAEQLKLQGGTACPKKDIRNIDYQGREIESGLSKSLTTTSQHIGQALEESLTLMVNAIHSAIEETPPELVSDIIETGITLTGGGALLKDIDIRLQNEVRLSVQIAKDPMTAIARGGEMLLHDFDLLKRVQLET
jgi:rod shape-determining protein MreB and related proteins